MYKLRLTAAKSTLILDFFYFGKVEKILLFKMSHISVRLAERIKVFEERSFYIVATGCLSANLYCNSCTSVLGRLRDYLRLLMGRTLVWKIHFSG